MTNRKAAHLTALHSSQKNKVSPTSRSAKVRAFLKQRAHPVGLTLVLLGCVVLMGSCLRGLKGDTDWNFSDFKCVYSGARCMLLGCNPYDEEVLIRTYADAGGDPVKWFPVRHYNANYLPPALVLALPFAALPWEPAKDLWILASLAAFLVAAVMAWDLGRPYAPILSGAFIGLFVEGSSMLLRTANPAGLAIALGVIAVWCFLKHRLLALGVASLAISLALKPHDVWLIWAWLFVSSSLRRRSALLVVVVFLAISVPAVVWFSATPASAHWVHDLRANLAGNVSRGFADDPGLENSWAFTLTNLQAVVAVFVDEASVYNPVAYLVAGVLFLVWMGRTWKRSPSPGTDLLSLAFISAVSLLPLYHRQYDTRLLLLVFPAAAVAWAGGGLFAWLSVLVAGACVLLTSTRVMLGLSAVSISAGGMLGKVETMLLHRALALVVLLLSVFHLVLYVRATARRRLEPSKPQAAVQDGPVNERRFTATG